VYSYRGFDALAVVVSVPKIAAAGTEERVVEQTGGIMRVRAIAKVPAAGIGFYNMIDRSIDRGSLLA